MFWDDLPVQERLAVRREREKALEHFRALRAVLAADPAATEGDLEMLGDYIRWTEQKLGILTPEEEGRRAFRRRTSPRERVRRHRARKQADATRQSTA